MLCNKQSQLKRVWTLTNKMSLYLIYQKKVTHFSESYLKQLLPPWWLYHLGGCPGGCMPGGGGPMFIGGGGPPLPYCCGGAPICGVITC